MRHQCGEQVAVALKERQDVPLEGHGCVAQLEAIRHIWAPADAVRRRQSRHSVNHPHSRERRAVARLRRIQVDDAIRGVQVFRQLQFPHALDAERAQRRRQPVERVTGGRQQLTRLTRVAQIVRAFAEEADPLTPDVQPRPHPIALFQ